MKKLFLFALLFAAVAGAAQAQEMPPLQNHLYSCDYTNPSMGELDPGSSNFSFVYLNAVTLKEGIEYYQVPGRTENRKATFAFIADRYRRNIRTGELELWATDWEFTINPNGPQCTARVTEDGGRISFINCSNGSSRICR